MIPFKHTDALTKTRADDDQRGYPMDDNVLEELYANEWPPPRKSSRPSVPDACAAESFADGAGI